jgi:hypothetical protein
MASSLWSWVWPKRPTKTNVASPQAYARPEPVTGWERRRKEWERFEARRANGRASQIVAPQTIDEIIAADIARLEAIGRPAEKSARPMSVRRAAEVRAQTDDEVLSAILRR